MQFWSLTGLTKYEDARRLQLALVDARADDQIPDTVLFVEHEPVVTRGRGLQRGLSDVDASGKPLPRQIALPGPLPAGVAFAESERGGDLTYHGPGQLVIYPICKLDGRGFGPARDVAGFLRRFEHTVIELIGEWSDGAAQGLACEGATGVWVHKSGESKDRARKIASMGIAVRRWVTYHGLAINCVNDLGGFHLISPCGFAPEVMTRLSDWLPSKSETARALGDWPVEGRTWLEARIAQKLAPRQSTSHIQNLSALDLLTHSLAREDHLLGVLNWMRDCASLNGPRPK